MRGQHCEFINLENGTSAIVCGVPDRCDHDDNGPVYYLFIDKQTGEDVWISAKDVDKQGLQRESMIGASSSCSKCGALAIDYCDMNLI
jgi:hypothetical protein